MFCECFEHALVNPIPPQPPITLGWLYRYIYARFAGLIEAQRSEGEIRDYAVASIGHSNLGMLGGRCGFLLGESGHLLDLGLPTAARDYVARWHLNCQVGLLTVRDALE